MVEAACVSLLFVIIWYAAVYAHNLGSTAAKLNSEAREQAWNYAMANCDQGQGDSPTTPADWGATESPGPLNPVPGNPPKQPKKQGGNSSVMNAIEGFLGKLFVNPEGSLSIENGAVRFRVPDYSHKSTPSTMKNMKVQVLVYCNEKAQNGSITQILGMIFGDLFHFP
jgi:hypothetical protein